MGELRRALDVPDDVLLLDYALSLKREVEMWRSRPTWFRFLTRYQVRRRCWHHDRHTGKSWLKEQMIHHGMGKMIWCGACDKTWFL